MTENSNELTKRIEALLAVANQRLADQARQSTEESQQMQKRFLVFNEVAVSFLNDEIGTRVKQLTSYFPNATIEFAEVTGTHGVICRFKHTSRFPASVELRFACAHDDRVEQFICSYDLEILPVFIKFEKHDQVASPLEPLDRSTLCQWLDDKIVQFLETYLKLEFADQYQRENHVTDPVAKARLNRAIAAAETKYKGQTFYFLSDENRRMFEAAPEKYILP
ncbi:MAG: YHS domain-containing protein [Planctomycetes bacterium]|nr:YHS domain-containing protein [Planctomycetota bacterium]